MRVLNVHSFHLEEISPDGGSPPTYAILSHRWEKDSRDEVLYEDLVSAEHDLTQKGPRQKKGFAKVEGACKQAARDGYDHIWIDSCCINQNSSAELSESINSMYRFYTEAKVCYAFLAGLPPGVDLNTDESFERHEWFTRGWTLQELIAPTSMVFYTDEQVEQRRTSNWIRLAEKAAICERLAAITNIEASVLSHKKPVTHVSVARRMSWASRRVTTKPEDRAYSLLGLFGVNMTMIYGEGKTNAFLRLQQEIMKVSSDQSIFAWRDFDATPGTSTGLLATAPEMFKDSGDFFGYSDWERVEPITNTNLGLQVTLPLRSVQLGTFIAALNCPKPGGSTGFAGIYLRIMRTANDHNGDKQYAPYERVHSDKLEPIDHPGERGHKTSIVVRHSGTQAQAPVIYPHHVLQLRRGPDSDVGWTLNGAMGKVSPVARQQGEASWITNPQYRAFQLPQEPGYLAAVLVFARRDGSQVTMLLGSGDGAKKVDLQIVEGYPHQTFGEWAQRFRFGAAATSPPQPDPPRELVSVETSCYVIHTHQYYLVDIVAEPNSAFQNEEDGEAPSPPPQVAETDQRPVGRMKKLRRAFNITPRSA